MQFPKILGVAIFIVFSGARADSWPPPVKRTITSAKSDLRLTVTPRDISGPKEFFEDKADGREPAGQRPKGAQHPHGVLEKRLDGEHWQTVWESDLINDVAPGEILIGETGRYVATFDNWHSIGNGDDVIVIYDTHGTSARTFGLKDFLPMDYIAALPRSVSSTYWSGDNSFSDDGDSLILKIVVPAEGKEKEEAYVDLRLDLANGKISPVDLAAWGQAVASANRVAATQRAEETAWKAARIAPLVAPTSDNVTEWHVYLSEVFSRYDPDWKDGSAATKVVHAPNDEKYQSSVKWLRDELRDKHYPGDCVMIGSPAQKNMVSVLAQELREIPEGHLKGVKVYVVLDDGFRKPVAEALAPTGAMFIPINPRTPIPQRAERLPHD